MFCVNKSGQKVPVYDAYYTTQIGVLYPREAFGWDANWGGEGVFCRIVFLNSQGKLQVGFLKNAIDYNGLPAPVGVYPYDRVYIDGNWYVTFKFRRTENVYTADGNYWGQVAAGMRVACLDDGFMNSLSGDTHPEWKAINYVERSTDKAWIKVSGAGKNYGFVDTGLSKGSMPDTISMYGSW